MSSLALSSKVYFCSVLQGIPVCRIRPLIRTIRSSVRTIFRIPRSDHISISVKMKSIGFLNIQQRSLYRILCIAHKARMTNRPRYICDMFSPSKISRNLR